MAAEQGRSDLAFERPDLLAQGRLLQAQLPGCTCDVAAVGNGHEVTQVTQLHMQKVSRCPLRAI
jgi:hypothetical protein